MSTSTKTKSPLPWFGSDNTVAPRLGAYFDDCAHVTIPFAGGLGILPHLKARAILANDKHAHAINFYNCLKSPTLRDELVANCQETLAHPYEFAAARSLLSHMKEPLNIGRDLHSAYAFWRVCWLGRKGQAGGENELKGEASIRRGAGGGTNATRLKAAAADLLQWAREFERVEFTCEDYARTIAKAHDKPENGLYIDAPWIDAPYLHRFTEADHCHLSAMLLMFEKAKILVRYGRHPLIEKLYPMGLWQWTEATSKNQAGGAVQEVWITNQQMSFAQ